ncbi:hypothetical protein ALQ57_04762, partial [Pseudomonas amygdali pv. hibisci]
MFTVNNECDGQFVTSALAAGPRRRRFTCPQAQVEWRLSSHQPEPVMSLPTFRIIGFIIGIFLITLAVAMIVPMATLVIYDRFEDLREFLWASA